MSEWLKEPVLKTGDGSAVRGFESRSLLCFRASYISLALFFLLVLNFSVFVLTNLENAFSAWNNKMAEI